MQKDSEPLANRTKKPPIQREANVPTTKERHALQGRMKDVDKQVKKSNPKRSTAILGGNIQKRQEIEHPESNEARDRPRGKTGMSDIQEISTFQGKCGILRETFFPADVVTPPSIQAGWLAPPPLRQQ